MHTSIEKLKRENLVTYLINQGFTVDYRGKTSQNFNKTIIVRRCELKIAVKQHSDGHWTYINTHFPQDCGSIIDWRIAHEGMSFASAIATPLFFPTVSRIAAFSLAEHGVNLRNSHSTPKEQWENCSRLIKWDYFESRGLKEYFLENLYRFNEVVRQDKKGRVVFRHDNAHLQPCGFEIKGHKYTGFCPGGEKGLFWIKSDAEAIEAIVFAETALDALSYGQTFPRSNCALASFAGNWNKSQPKLISAVLRKYSHAEIIIATDADSAGDNFAQKILNMGTNRTIRARPPYPHKDWNDVLQFK